MSKPVNLLSGLYRSNIAFCTWALEEHNNHASCHPGLLNRLLRQIKLLRLIEEQEKL